MMKEMGELLSIKDFKNWESEYVRIRFTEEDIHEARIMELKSLEGQDKDERAPFSFILLTEMKDRYYNQGTFAVVLPDGREEMIFMVPIGVDSDTGGVRYEVIFN